MKRITLFLLCFISSAYCEDFFTQKTLKLGIKYYFEIAIPLFYQNKLDETKTRNELSQNLKIWVQGSSVFYLLEPNKKLCFNFYYLVNHDRQDVQAILLLSKHYDDYTYEYWGFSLSDKGTPYNYAYFYLTRASSKESKREILNISKKYMESYILENGNKLDLTIDDSFILFQLKPWLKLESFKDTKYENMIIKWKKNVPCIYKMNFLEYLYFNHIKKSNK